MDLYLQSKPFGVSVFHEPTNSRAQAQFPNITERDEVPIGLLCGMACDDFELCGRAYSVDQICPRYAIEIAPYALREPTHPVRSWNEVVVADSPCFSSIMSQSRRIYFWGTLRNEHPHYYVGIYDWAHLIATCACRPALTGWLE